MALIKECLLIEQADISSTINTEQNKQNKRGSSNNGIDQRMIQQYYQQYQTGTPNNGNDPRMSPQQYKNGNPNNDQRLNYRRTPSNDPRMYPQEPFKNNDIR